MAFNYKKALALALSAAMVVTAAPVAGLDVQAAAKKQATAATKITPTKASYNVTVGKSTAAITLKLNKKTTKKVTINLKSSNKKVATVSKSKVTIKKGKAGTKSASFKIKGVKKGSAKITASFTNSKGKKVSKTIKVTVKKAAATKVAVTGVTLSNTTPKVGDTITANVAPSDASNVTYQWFTGDTASLTTEIAGATSKTYTVTDAELGKFVGVVVKGENDSTATAVSAVAVQKADSSEIAVKEAKQIGMAKIKVSLSGKVTASDKITVKKGNNEVKISEEAFDDEAGSSKTLTLADNISSGTYTVTLTPADTNVKASSVEFTGVSATKATKIGFPNKYLVMANTDFDTGYAYIKGYNDFDEEITLSGIQINAAPSDTTTYDASTGKITVKYANPGFAVVKNVSVFAQYTGADGNILTAQETLEVSTVGYPSTVTFGEVKKDGTARKDGKLTIAELGSNKYYVEVNEIKDQYGNDLSADDLNKLVTDRLVTVIPQNGSPVFFGTNATPFATMNGKVVIFLTRGTGMPGKGTLMITGAGGSFNKEVEVSDNPYIQTMTVDVPDIYENEKTKAFSFSATDQYGEAVNLYDFAPAEGTVTNGKLEFTDKNNLTKQVTTVQGESTGTWEVKKDTAKKTFTVFYTPAGQAKGMATFTTITAGMTTTVQSVTIGEVSGASTIIGQTSSAQLDPGELTYNIAKKIQFKDANGKTMDRVADAARYPKFLYAPALQTDDTIKSDNYVDYYWTVSEAKLATNSSNATPAVAALSNSKAGEWYDNDGVINQAANAAGTLGANAANATPSYYITLLASDGTNYKVLDSKAFRFVYAPVSNTRVKYTVKDISKALLYAAPGSEDTEEIKLIASNEAGESWEVPADSLTPDAPFTSTGNILSGDIATKFDDDTDGTVNVKVYKTDASGDLKAVDTIQIKYSNRTPVASGTKVKMITAAGNNNGTTPEGLKWDDDTTRFDLETKATVVAAESMKDGVFELKNATAWGDTFTAEIKDQYDVTMKDADVKLDGKTVTTKAAAIAQGKEGNFVITKGNQKVDLRVSVPNRGGSAVSTTKATGTSVAASNYTALSESQMKTQLAYATAANPVKVTLGANVATTANLNIPAYATLVVPSAYQLTLSGGAGTAGHNLTVAANGKLVVEGQLFGDNDATGGADARTYTIDGTVTINGTWSDVAQGTVDLDGASTGLIDGSGHVNWGSTAAGTWAGTFAGTVNVLGSTLVIQAAGGTTFNGAATVKGHTVFAKDVTFSNASAKLGGEVEIADLVVFTTTATLTLINGTELKISESANVAGADDIKIAQNESITIESSDGTVTSVKAEDGNITSGDLTSKGVNGDAHATNKTEATVSAKIAYSCAGAGNAADLSSALLAVGISEDASHNPITSDGAETDYAGATNLGWCVLSGLDTTKYYATVITTTSGSAISTSVSGGAYTVTGKTKRVDYWATENHAQVNLNFPGTATYKLYVIDQAPVAANLTGWTVDATDHMYHKGADAADLENLGWTLLDTK